MKTEEKVFTFLIFLVVLVMVLMTFQYRAGARQVPLIVGFCTLALMVVLCIMAIFPRFALWYQKVESKSLSTLLPKDEEPDVSEADGELFKFKRKERSVVGWLLFLIIATYILGFIVAIPLFLFLFLKIWAKEGWVLSICMSGVVLGVVFLVFDYILHVPFHKGILF